MSDAVLTTVSAGIATLTLNNPDNRNALSTDLVNGLGDALTAALGDDTVRAIVLTNNGNTFCAGANLKAGGNTGSPRYGFEQILATIMDAPKPIIGRIAGHCAGGGVGLASSCDISVIDEEATVGFSEARIGVAPAIISVVCLPKLRRADASELFLRANRISGTRAAEVGLINYAVPAAELDAKVAEVAGDCARGGPLALGACKELIQADGFADRTEWFAWAAKLSRDLFASEEAKEGMASFRDKRDAAWVPTEG